MATPTQPTIVRTTGPLPELPWLQDTTPSLTSPLSTVTEEVAHGARQRPAADA